MSGMRLSATGANMVLDAGQLPRDTDQMAPGAKEAGNDVHDAGQLPRDTDGDIGRVDSTDAA